MLNVNFADEKSGGEGYVQFQPILDKNTRISKNGASKQAPCQEKSLI